MILTCEECQTRYLVPSRAIGDEGRTVRCSHCAHEWFQEPEDILGDDDESFEEDDFEPIPESVKPLPEGSSVPAIQEEENTKKPATWIKTVAGYCAALCVAGVIGAAMLALYKPIVSAWPNTAVLFDMAGYDIPVKGEKLLFKVKSAKVQTDDEIDILHVKGSLINLEMSETHVPYVQVTLVKEDGNIADRWIIEDTADIIGSEGEMQLDIVYPDVPRDVVEVKLQLVPYKKAPMNAAAKTSVGLTNKEENRLEAQNNLSKKIMAEDGHDH